MCHKAVDNHALKFVSDRYKAQKMCVKAFDTHASAIKYVNDQYKTQKMCVKAVNT